MLVKDVGAEFAGRVRVAVEEYGNSPLAQRFGVRRYPAVFVDDVLLARPKDFGFGGEEDVSGALYVPWREPANQRRFKDDLRKAVASRLRGERVAGFDIADLARPAEPLDGPATFPRLSLSTIDGRTVDPSVTANRTVVVELWATWCPPCRSTLQQLNTLQQTHEKDLTIIAVAVDSKREDVVRMARQVGASYHVVLATPEILRAFGEVAAVPKLLVFDRAARLRQVIHGAPPDLHQKLDAAVRTVIE